MRGQAAWLGLGWARTWPAGCRAPRRITIHGTTRFWPAGAPPPTSVTSSTMRKLGPATRTTSSSCTSKHPPLSVQGEAPIELMIKTLQEATSRAEALIVSMQKTIADHTRSISMLKEAVDICPCTPSTRTSCTQTPSTTGPTTSPSTLPMRAPHFTYTSATNYEHPFIVTHFDANRQYSFDDFRIRRAAPSACDSGSCSPPTSTCTSASSSPVLGHSRVPREVVQRLDDIFLECGELDPACIDELVRCTLEAVYNETSYLDFWDRDDGDRVLSMLMKTRYPHFFP